MSTPREEIERLLGMPGAKPDVDALIEKHAAENFVDPDLIRRIIKQESGGTRKAVSPKGARGYMQLMPGTAKTFGVTDPFDADQNIGAGVKYLRQQLDRFGDVSLALAAYNAGPDAVARRGNRVPPYRETKNYVQSIGGGYKGTGYHPTATPQEAIDSALGLSPVGDTDKPTYDVAPFSPSDEAQNPATPTPQEPQQFLKSPEPVAIAPGSTPVAPDTAPTYKPPEPPKGAQPASEFTSKDTYDVPLTPFDKEQTGALGVIGNAGPEAQAGYIDWVRRNAHGKPDAALTDEAYAQTFVKIQRYMGANPKAKPEEVVKEFAKLGQDFVNDPATKGKQLPKTLHDAMLRAPYSEDELKTLPSKIRQQREQIARADRQRQQEAALQKQTVDLYRKNPEQLNRSIAWHFGEETLKGLGNLPAKVQKHVALMAVAAANEDERKRREAAARGEKYEVQQDPGYQAKMREKAKISDEMLSAPTAPIPSRAAEQPRTAFASNPMLATPRPTDSQEADVPQAKAKQAAHLTENYFTDLKARQARLEQQYSGAERANIAFQLKSDDQLRQEAQQMTDERMTMEAKRPEIDALKNKIRAGVGDSHGARLAESLWDALASTGVQAGNLIKAVTLGKRGSGYVEQMRLAQTALAELEHEDPNKGWIAAAERVLPGAAFDLSKMYMMMRVPVLGRATLPGLGALSEADKGAGAAIGGAIKGELFQRGFGLTAAMRPVGKFLTWTSIPAAIAIAEGEDPKKALLSNTAFGALAMVEPRSVEVRDGGEVRPATVEDAPKIESGELKVVKPSPTGEKPAEVPKPDAPKDPFAFRDLSDDEFEALKPSRKDYPAWQEEAKARGYWWKEKFPLFGNAKLKPENVIQWSDNEGNVHEGTPYTPDRFLVKRDKIDPAKVVIVADKDGWEYVHKSRITTPEYEARKAAQTEVSDAREKPIQPKGRPANQPHNVSADEPGSVGGRSEPSSVRESPKSAEAARPETAQTPKAEDVSRQPAVASELVEETQKLEAWIDQHPLPEERAGDRVLVNEIIDKANERNLSPEQYIEKLKQAKALIERQSVAREDVDKMLGFSPEVDRERADIAAAEESGIAQVAADMGVSPTGETEGAIKEPPKPEGKPAEGFTRLYRGEAAKTGKALPSWIQAGKDESGASAAEGRWFTDDPAKAQWYVDDAGKDAKLTYVDVPTEQIDQYRVANQPSEIARYSLDPSSEFFIPKNIADKRVTSSSPEEGARGVAGEPEEGLKFGPGAANVGDVPAANTMTQLSEAIGKLPKGSRARETTRAALDAADKVSQGKDAIVRALTRMKAIGESVLTRPIVTDYKKALGDFLFAAQKSDHETRQFAKQIKKQVPSKLRREAITNFIQAGGDPAVLAQRATASKLRLRLGYEEAQRLTDEEKTIATNIMSYYDSRWQEAHEAGILNGVIENYVNQAWSRRNPVTDKLMADVQRGLLEPNFKHARQRVFESFFEGEQAGYKPLTKDIGSLLSMYNQSLDRAIFSRQFIQTLHGTDATDGRPNVEISGSGQALPEGESPPEQYVIRPHTKQPSMTTAIARKRVGLEALDLSDYRVIDHPALRGWKWLLNTKGENKTPVFMKGDMIVHPEAYEHLKNVLGRSWFSGPSNLQAVARGVKRVQTTIKGTMFSLSGFHQVQEAVHALGHRVNPITGTVKLDFDDPTQSLLVKRGLQVASFDAMQEFGEGLTGGNLANKIPIVGPRVFQPYQEWLFRDYIPRLKMTMALDALERNTKRYSKSLSTDQIAEMTAEQSNAAFGELNYRYMGRNPTLQDVYRVFLLAPDFLEARGRFVGQAIKPEITPTETGKKLEYHGTEQLAALGLLAVTQYTSARILNKLLNGDYHWEPENAFRIMYGKRWFGVRTVPADIAHLISDPRGFAYHRLSPIAVAGITATTGRDDRGQKVDAAEQIKNFLKSPEPIVLKRHGDDAWWESFANSMGLQEGRYYTPAEEVIRDYYNEKFPGGFPKSSDPERAELKKQLLKQERGGQDVEDDILRLADEGKLSRDDVKSLFKKGQLDSLQSSFIPLPLAVAVTVFEKADKDQRAKLEPLLKKKMKSGLKKLPEAERDALRERIDKVLE